MKLSKMSKVELELLSYTDLTEMILKENKKAMNTPSIFKKICELLDYSDAEYSAKIGDYYTSLTIDKRFILLDSAEWDLKQNYVIPLEVEEDEDSEDFVEEILEEEEIEEETSEEEEDIDTEIDDDDLVDDDVDEELENLSIIDEDEEADFDDEDEEKLSD